MKNSCTTSHTTRHHRKNMLNNWKKLQLPKCFCGFLETNRCGSNLFLVLNFNSLPFTPKVWAFAAAVERDPKGMEGLSLDCLSSNSTLEKKTREWGGVVLIDGQKLRIYDMAMICSKLRIFGPLLGMFCTSFFQWLVVVLGQVWPSLPHVWNTCCMALSSKAMDNVLTCGFHFRKGEAEARHLQWKRFHRFQGWWTILKISKLWVNLRWAAFVVCAWCGIVSRFVF